MNRNRLKADNAEQLAEIIKAIQRGEEPTQESIRRNTESAPMADSPMSGSEEADTEKTAAKELSEESGPSKWQRAEDTPESRKRDSQEPEDTDESRKEEPQEPEEEEDWEGISPKEFVQNVSGWIQKIRGSLQKKKSQKIKTKGTGETDRLQKTAEDNEEAYVPLNVMPQDARKEKEEKAAEEDFENEVQKGTEEESEKQIQTAEDNDFRLEDEFDDFGTGLLGRKRVRLTDTMEENERFRPSKRMLRKTEDPDETGDSEENEGVAAAEPEKKTEIKANPESEEKPKRKAMWAFRKKQNAKAKPESEEKIEQETRPESEEKTEQEAKPESEEKMEQEAKPESEEKTEQEAKPESEEETKPEETLVVGENQKKPDETPKSGRNNFGRRFLGQLQEHGLGLREIGMILAGVILAVLVVVLVGKTIAGMVSDSQKSENVTADKGLRVTVEDEPTSWSSRWPVKLKFKASGATVTGIRINGTECTADNQGLVTYEADSWQLTAEVDTDQGETLQAKIEIPMLDGEAPVVHAVRKQDKIELTAADARSTVTGIYYAVIDAAALMNIPEYQKYSSPIAYEENKRYYFYAEDAAGNCSVPIVTSMETAEKLVLNQEAIHLYPNGSAELTVEAYPEGALLENLRYESMNPELFSVNEKGMVTALGEGTGSIKVSADGVADAVCTVTVSDTKTVTVSTLGDCTLGTDAYFSTVNSFNAYDTANGHDYFLANVKSILEEDDVTFANLEGTFTTSDERADKQYAFKGDPDYTEILTDGSVEVVTLANNHSGDYGEQGLADTKAALESAGIDYCIGDTIAWKEINGIRIAFIGIFVNYGTDDSENQLRADIETAQKQGAELIITAFHWGSEKATQPDETQQSLAHTAIDCGADLVVGHHPHVLQGIEQYQGKYIVYSLGNFCFGGNSNPSDMDTMIFRQTFTISSEGTEENSKATVIPCSISSDAGYNNYQPTPAEGEAATAIIERLNEYSASYGVTVAEDGSVSKSGS